MKHYRAILMPKPEVIETRDESQVCAEKIEIRFSIGEKSPHRDNPDAVVRDTMKRLVLGGIMNYEIQEIAGPRANGEPDAFGDWMAEQPFGTLAFPSAQRLMRKAWDAAMEAGAWRDNAVQRKSRLEGSSTP